MDIKLIIGTILVTLAGGMTQIGPALHLPDAITAIVIVILGGIATVLGVKTPSTAHADQVSDLEAAKARLEAQLAQARANELKK